MRVKKSSFFLFSTFPVILLSSHSPSYLEPSAQMYVPNNQVLKIACEIIIKSILI